MKKYTIYILLTLMAFVLINTTAYAQKKHKRAKQSSVKKKITKTKSKKRNTVKIVKSFNSHSDVIPALQPTSSESVNRDSIPEKVVTILSAFKPQLKHLAKIDFVNASESKDTGSVHLEYQVPSQNLSFQYQPIPLVPRSFKLDSIILLEKNTTIQFGYGNYFHHYINLNHYFVDNNKNTHSFNLMNEAITGEHHLQSTRILGINYLGDYIISKNNHLVSQIYYNQIERYRYGLVPDTTIYPNSNYKQNNFLSGLALNWINSQQTKNNAIQYSPNFVFERFEGIEAATNYFIKINSPLNYKINDQAKLNFDFTYSMNQFNKNGGASISNHLIRIEPNLVFLKNGSEIKVGVSPVLTNNELHLFPDIAFKRNLKDTNLLLFAGWHAYVNNNKYSDLVSQNPWIAVPSQMAITTEDSKFIGLDITNGKRLTYGFSLSMNDYTNLLLFNKKLSTNLLYNGLYYNSIFEKKASTIQLDAHLRYQFSDHVIVSNQLKYIQFNALEENAKPWGILPLELNSKITWNPNKSFQLNGLVQYWTGSTLYNETQLPYDLDNALVLNASMSYKLSNHFTAWLKGENLLNKPYQRWSNYPSLGVQLIAGVVYSFK